ncbi:alpha/beta hydrolase [Roseomonas sp. NAR14]|uniref:Alpha/beta hydrolase n=1 Tax=Roseomonas acroporae TaxID=2937791 RepID=A0A9X1YI60_9PROT|nr:alpha/beta hydrolase [Roseomonas acroporae]MCK8786631.1 alpha/beta hydrolase [Roseomonas acroporae]
MYQPLPDFWNEADQATRDDAYNNNKAVPDCQALMAKRNEASAALRAARPDHLDLPYGEGESNRWDLFPASEPGAPCLVFIHGGYWQRNRRHDFGALTEGALAMGWSTALPGYTLAPEATLTGIVNEIHRALDWLAAEGPRHGIAGKVVLSGWSAGGHLTAMGMSHPLVTAGLAISGIYELAPIRDTYLDEKLRLSEDELAALSPLRLAPVTKPVAVAYGSAELPELRRQSRHWHGQRAEAHLRGPLIPVAGANHFTVVDALSQPGGELARAAADLLL